MNGLCNKTVTLGNQKLKINPIYLIRQDFAIDLREISSLKNNIASGLTVVYKSGRYVKFQEIDDREFEGLLRAWDFYNS